MRSLNLSELVEDRHGSVSFNDSLVRGVSVDYVARQATLRVSIDVGDGRAKEPDFKGGALRFTGLLFLSNEMPAAPPEEFSEGELWLTDDGALPNDQVDVSASLPAGLPKEAFAHYFFFSDQNGYMVIAATDASFAWD